jgi:hypothetical protein
MIAGGVVAGAAFVGGVLYYLLGPGKGDEKAAWQNPAIVPWSGAHASGLSLSGRF